MSAGQSDFGLSVTSPDGDIGIAFVEPPAGENETRYWVAVDAAGLTARLSLSSDITATVSSITVQINQAGGTGPDGTAAVPLNWLSSVSGTAVPVNPGANLDTQTPIGSYTGSTTATDTITLQSVHHGGHHRPDRRQLDYRGLPARRPDQGLEHHHYPRRK